MIKTISLLSVFLILSCGKLSNRDNNKPSIGIKAPNQSGTINKTTESTLEKSTSLIIEQEFLQWENYLIRNSIFDYVMEADCRDSIKMEKLYQAGKYPMHTVSVKNIAFDLNGDTFTDYLVNYDLDNCVRGSSTANDFIIFSSTASGKLHYDLSVGNVLKSQLLQVVHKKLGKDALIYQKNNYIITNKLRITHLDLTNIYGIFYMQGNGPNCCPEWVGNFSFNYKNKHFKVLTIKKNVD